MMQLRVLCELQVLQDSTCCDNALTQGVDAESLEVLDFKMPKQFVHRCLGCKNPVIEFESDEFATEAAFEHSFSASFVEHFLGSKVAHQLIHIFGCALCYEPLARRDVKKAHAHVVLFGKMDSGEKIVLAIVEHGVSEGHTRGNKLRDAAFHQFLGQFGVFKLVADGYTAPGSDEFGQICVQRMMGETSHRSALILPAVITLGQGYTQDVGSFHRILSVGLIEISTPEEEDGIGMLGLQVEELFHHRGLLSHGFSPFHPAPGALRPSSRSLSCGAQSYW